MTYQIIYGWGKTSVFRCVAFCGRSCVAKSCNMADTNFKRLPNSSHFNVISCLCYIIMLHVLTWTQKKKKRQTEHSVEMLGCSCRVQPGEDEQSVWLWNRRAQPTAAGFFLKLQFCFCSLSMRKTLFL